MRTAVKAVIAVSCAAAVVGGTFGGYKYNEKRKKNKAVADVILVSYVTDQYWGDGLQLEGTISSGDVQKVTQNESMLVSKILVKEGDKVKKGTPLVKYDMTLLELDVKQKKNTLAVAEDNINQANKEITRLKNLKPSESIPPMPEPTEPPPPVVPEKPQIPVVMQINDGSAAISGTGAQNDPYVFNCVGETLVSAAFLNIISENGFYADFNVYKDNVLIYMWSVNGANLFTERTEDWVVGANVETDGMGNVTVDYSSGCIGSFKAFAVSEEDTYENDYEYSDYESLQEEYEQSFIKNGSDDYIYSKAEIAKMISDKQAELKELELDKKSADIAYRQALAKQEDGQELSLIDGVVTSVNNGEEEETDSALVVVQGSSGVTVKVMIGELNLDKISVGSTVSVNSYETGAYADAEITSIDMTPVEDYQLWNDNPNSSTYTFNASITGDTEGFDVGSWVGVSIEETEVSDGFYIPLHFTREENGRYYVMKAGKNDLLEKQYIKTGKTVYGSEIEIKGGLSQEDKICFPYGKNIKEGIKTRETDEIPW